SISVPRATASPPARGAQDREGGGSGTMGRNPLDQVLFALPHNHKRGGRKGPTGPLRDWWPVHSLPGPSSDQAAHRSRARTEPRAGGGGPAVFSDFSHRPDQQEATASASPTPTGSATTVRIRAISLQLGKSGQRTHSFQILCGSSDFSTRW